MNGESASLYEADCSESSVSASPTPLFYFRKNAGEEEDKKERRIYRIVDELMISRALKYTTTDINIGK